MLVWNEPAMRAVRRPLKVEQNSVSLSDLRPLPSPSGHILLTVGLLKLALALELLSSWLEVPQGGVMGLTDDKRVE